MWAWAGLGSGALSILAGGFYRHRFGVAQQDQFVHGELRQWLREARGMHQGACFSAGA
jgi:hypothetical protein